MKIKVTVFLLLICLIQHFTFAKEITVNPSNATIIIPANAKSTEVFAAKELAAHLKLITGTDIPVIKNKTPQGKYTFLVGIRPADASSASLKPEEACYTVTDKATWLYGDDNPVNNKLSPRDASLHKYSRTGTLFAVYSFLERELDVKWLEPGNENIVYKPTAKLSLQTGSYTWIPQLTMREIRPGYGRVNADIPAELQISKQQLIQKRQETQLWLKRMKMGRSRIFSYGHAFTKWWDQYGKSHPEYFALNDNGQRKPWSVSQPDRIKMCVSNPALHQQIVDNWLKSRGTSNIINVCENDSAGYCRCAKCCALDAPKPGEKFGDNMTDRYIWFANQVQRLARKKVPDAQAIMYAYSVYRFPPRKIKVDDGVILGFVPKLPTLNSELEKYYQSWQKAGAGQLFLRPNDMHIDTGMPMGFEKKMFDNFKICMKYGAFGTDYDSLHNYWQTSGIANYILARAIADPDKSFEHWESEYCDTFGPAAEDIKKYFRYWRDEIWEKRLMPNRKEIIEKGRYGNFRRGLMWNLQDYYRPADFDRTDAILQDALKKKLTADERKRVETLCLSNQHARLMYEAMKAKNAHPMKMDVLKKAANALLDFRIKNKDRLNCDWQNLFFYEKLLGDVCGMNAVEAFSGLDIIKQLPNTWAFKLDPGNVGLKENWQELPWSKINSTWDRLSTSAFWEKASQDKDLKKKLEKYDGIGWYAVKITVPREYKEKKIYLLFGAVDESCWVFINGREAGKHLFEKVDDWKTPFKISIEKLIDWSNPVATIVVRVEDKAGVGGIWRPVWLVCNS